MFLTSHDAVRGSQTGEDSVHGGKAQRLSRHITAQLGQDNDQTTLQETKKKRLISCIVPALSTAFPYLFRIRTDTEMERISKLHNEAEIIKKLAGWFKKKKKKKSYN